MKGSGTKWDIVIWGGILTKEQEHAKVSAHT